MFQETEGVDVLCGSLRESKRFKDSFSDLALVSNMIYSEYSSREETNPLHAGRSSENQQGLYSDDCRLMNTSYSLLQWAYYWLCAEPRLHYEWR